MERAPKISLYPLAHPSHDEDNPVWPYIGEEVEEVNYVAQLMMLGKRYFMQLQDEDEVLSNIIQNHCEVEEASSSHFVVLVRTLLPALLATTLPVTTLPATRSMSHTLLPYELKVPCVNEAVMIESTTQVQVLEGKYLNINNKLNEEQLLLEN